MVLSSTKWDAVFFVLFFVMIFAIMEIIDSNELTQIEFAQLIP